MRVSYSTAIAEGEPLSKSAKLGAYDAPVKFASGEPLTVASLSWSSSRFPCNLRRVETRFVKLSLLANSVMARYRDLDER
jgi:hypothetical protein